MIKKIIIQLFTLLAMLLYSDYVMGQSLSNIEYDYLNHKYKYLNNDFTINIDSRTFENSIRDNGIFKGVINSYRDSLLVVMCLEFKDPDMVRSASFIIGYSWNRVGYHIWTTPDEARMTASKLGFTHPWQFMQKLREEKGYNIFIEQTVANLKTKLSKHVSDPASLDNLTRNDLLNLGLRLNPVRSKDLDLYKKANDQRLQSYKKRDGAIDPSKIGVGCEEENCCQK